MATDDEARQILHAAQVALHSIYARDKDTANRLYNDLETWARSGHKPLFGHNKSPASSLNDAHTIITTLTNQGGQDAQDAQAITAVLALPASQVIKLGGFAPASANPKSVSQSFPESAKASIPTSVTGFLSALTNPHTWLRVAEVILGLLLIGVGVAKLTDAVPIATKLAATLA